MGKQHEPVSDHAQAARFITFLSGDAGSIECFCARKNGVAGMRHVHGAITDPKIAKKLADWELNGFDLYLVVHLIREGVTRKPSASDIAEGRALFIDSDGTARPNQWHLKPDFLLERDDHPELFWWAFWLIDGPFPAAAIEEHQRRLAAFYGTDSSVHDPARIVRLPGFIRWQHNESPGKAIKAERDTVYRLVSP